jgi:hypothetical protein
MNHVIPDVMNKIWSEHRINYKFQSASRFRLTVATVDVKNNKAW